MTDIQGGQDHMWLVDARKRQEIGNGAIVKLPDTLSDHNGAVSEVRRHLWSLTVVCH